jgi:ABC-2 type transport system permease protein
MSSAPATTVPALRVAPNSLHAFGGVWRLTYLRFRAPGQWVPLLAVLAVLALFVTAIVRDGGARVYFSMMRGFYLTFMVPFMAFLSGGGAMRDEMKGGSVDYVLTRPLRRPVFVVFKFVSHLACIQVLFLLGLVVMLAIAGFRHIPGVWPVLPWLLLSQVLLVTAFSAFGFFAGVLNSRFIIIGLLYGGMVEAGIGHAKIQLNRLALTHQVQAMLEPLLPFGPAVPVPGPGPLDTTVFILIYAAVMLVLAATVFSFQELLGAKPGEG